MDALDGTHQVVSHKRWIQSSITVFDVETKYPEIFSAICADGMDNFIIPTAYGLVLTQRFYTGLRKSNKYLDRSIGRRFRQGKTFSPLALKLLRIAAKWGQFLPYDKIPFKDLPIVNLAEMKQTDDTKRDGTDHIRMSAISDIKYLVDEKGMSVNDAYESMRRVYQKKALSNRELSK